MKRYSHKTGGVTCAPQIDFEIDDEGRLRNVVFLGGCAGNTRGLSVMLEGAMASDVARKLEGIQCQNGTSCPDQLSKALKAALKS